MAALYSEFIAFVQQNAGLISIITTIALAVFGGLTLYFDSRNDRREQNNVSVENRRLSEVNLKVEQRFSLIPQIEGEKELDALIKAKTRTYAMLQLPIENIGDGPVDILAALVSARQMPTDLNAGVGTRSRDVEWSDYVKFPWNHAQASNVFSGISTTKHMVSTADHFIRLAAHEFSALRRIDAINNVQALRDQPYVSLMYRAFVVARGYPLGEILRQLGGGPPDPIRNVHRELLQFQSLAQPSYFRWRLIQQAMININRFVFRLAIFEPLEVAPQNQEDYLARQESIADPLGVIAAPDAWRIFLLHHWEFIDDVDASPEDLPDDIKITGQPGGRKYSTDNSNDRLIKSVTGYVKKTWYPNLVIPDNWQEGTEKQKFDAARTYCREKLSHLIEAWQRMKATIKAVNEYQPDAQKARHKDYPDEGYAALIHNDEHFHDHLATTTETKRRFLLFVQKKKVNSYPKRWLALMQEGYLISKPFARGNRLTRFLTGNWLTVRVVRLLRTFHIRARVKLRIREIPDDPRVLEPYVIRTHFFLVNVDWKAKTPEAALRAQWENSMES